MFPSITTPRLASLLLVALLTIGGARAEWPDPRPIDEGRLAAAGVRVVEGEHATLVTDVDASPEIDGLPRLISLALPQWGERFGVDAKQCDAWRLRVYLIEDETRFRSLGLWPDKSPDFLHGLSLGHETWVRQQSADYYRRHLLLHEGTHSFMATTLGSCGPGWYMEGMAELCGTHTWEPESGELRLATMPASRKASGDWGRVRLIREAVDEGRVLSIGAVMRIDNRVVISTESYAWVWALCSFLDRHPAYRERFEKASGWVTSDAFDRRFERMYARDRRRLDQEWRLFVSILAYGHDIEREAITFEDGAPLATGAEHEVTIEAGRGWQSSGVTVEAGRVYRLAGAGRFVVGREPDGAPWPCEAGGVTLEYHAGRPLGQLLATIDAGPGAFVDATPIGLAADYTPPATGTLYLRVNDAPDALRDNEGELTVEIRAD